MKALHIPSPPLQEINSISPSPINMDQVAGIVLGGGEGSRLFPLTRTRCKPAVCFSGKYRLIDIPLSNCIHSNIHKMFVLTQFLSASLHRHLFQTYCFDRFSSGFLEILSAEQKPAKNIWFQGTADAVRQNLDYLMEAPVDYFLILSGDQLYHFNFVDMVRFAKNIDADMVLATLPVSAEEASRMGILRVDEEGWITDFYEKPQSQEILDRLASPFPRTQIPLDPYFDRPYLGSMGIYLFKRDVLIRLLLQDTREDFGKHLIPTQVRQGGAAAFIYQGYWEDIGTIKTFYHANLAMTQTDPPFSCSNENRPIYFSHLNLPPPKIEKARVTQSIFCEGSHIEAEEITRSILGPRTIVKEGTCIRDSYVMGNDFYRSRTNTNNLLSNELKIGRDCVIQRAIIDKNCSIGNGVKLVNKDNLSHYDMDPVFIRDGIIVVAQGAVIPAGFTL